ncbi:MAG: fructose-6-phosphate aldolase [Acidobacteria bacterium]|nr:fructose-6-phosphate aldolase [Acidobacteriota bacterium]
MQIFLDTANVDEISRAAAMGLVDGVTTNPSLMAKETGDPREILASIAELVPGDVSAEVLSTDTAGMVAEGRELATIASNIIIKCPLTPDGLRAVRALKEEGIRVNVTLCFSVPQALFAAKAGAYIVSPFVGRLDDISAPGMQLIADIREVYDNYGFATQILVASIRNPLHVVEAARLGADIATMPAKVLDLLIRHPLTEIGLERFLKDWEAARVS